MRTLLRVSVVALCLALAGCTASSSGRDGLLSRPASSAGSGQLFLGSPTGGGGSSATASNPTSNDPGSLASAGPTRREGVLAGRILDQESKLRPGAVIQVIDLEAPKDDGAPLSVLANRDGYFDISGLEAGRSYRLVARVKDGDRTITGSARVVPPNVRVAIWLKDEAPDEPAPEAKPSSGPAASLGAPIKTPAGVTTPLPDGESSRNPVPPPVTTKDPPISSADASLTATVPNASSVPGRDHTPEKPANSMPPPPPATPAEAPPSDAAKADIPETKTRVPSCVRTGGRVENFALYDARGEVYELARDRKGKLVLLDLWHTRCSPCIAAIPHLNKLHNKYSRHGLEVIGVAYEKGTQEEKQQALAKATQRLNLTFNYRVLFGGGSGKAQCPVAEQLELQGYPTLVLLDETGKIVHRTEGMDDRAAYELEAAIYQRLFPRRTAGR
ncbi:MAG: redoxin family protein [Gemmataceae bacterium]